MRIAFLGFRSVGTGSGGVERHVYELTVRLAALGHDIRVFYRSRYQTSLPDPGLGLRMIPKPAVYSKHLENVSHTLCSLPDAIRDSDIIHFHSMGPTLLSWIPKLFRKPVLATIHSLDFQREKWNAFARKVLYLSAWTSIAFPDATISVSRPMAGFYRENFGKAPVYIPNGINAPTRRPLERLRHLGLEEKGYILALGRLVPEKGYHYLIRAFRALDTDLKLVVAGAHTHTPEYVESLAALAGGDPRILFPGPIYNEEKDEIFSNARLFVLPSDLEGMPIVMLEAMSYGCPVLVSDIPANLDVMSGDREASRRALSGELGHFFRAGDIPGLTGLLAYLLQDSGLSAMGLRGREFVLGEYRWDAIVEQTLELYRRVLGAG
jgi:glycosyltransferase involved in cell wall biosynthesis